MNSSLHSSNNVRTLQAIAGVDPVHAGLLNLPDHQPAAYQPSSAAQPDTSAFMLPAFPVPAPTIAGVANSNGWAAKEAWAKHQADIEQFYLHERKTLAEVMRLMESEYGFKATVKMYKTYITTWGLDKKNKEPEMRAIVRKYKQREAQGKGSAIRIRKQRRNFADVVRYWERKGVSIDDIIARQTASPTPEAVEFSTPVSSPILTPSELTIPECMLRCIRDYFRGSFESGTWVRTEPETRYYSLKDENPASLMWPEFMVNCEMACTQLKRGSFHEAGQALNTATAKIKEVLFTEHPEILTDLPCLIDHFGYGRNRGEIALSILRQFAAMSRVVLGSQHPVTRFCEWSVSVHASVFHDTVTRCLELVSDELASFIGCFHVSTLEVRMNLLELMAIDEGACIQKSQKLLGECEQTLRPDDSRLFDVRAHMAYRYLRAGRYDEAMTLCQKSIVYAQSSVPARSYYVGYVLYLLAECQHALGEVDLGIATICQAIDLLFSRVGLRDSRARLWLVTLESCSLKQSLCDYAAQARERGLELLRR